MWPARWRTEKPDRGSVPAYCSVMWPTRSTRSEKSILACWRLSWRVTCIITDRGTGQRFSPCLLQCHVTYTVDTIWKIDLGLLKAVVTCDLRYDGLVCLEDLVGGLVSVCCPDMTDPVALIPILASCRLPWPVTCAMTAWCVVTRTCLPEWRVRTSRCASCASPEVRTAAGCPPSLPSTAQWSPSDHRPVFQVSRPQLTPSAWWDVKT